jgi:hypothetical protein
LHFTPKLVTIFTVVPNPTILGIRPIALRGLQKGFIKLNDATTNKTNNINAIFFLSLNIGRKNDDADTKLDNGR